MDLVSSRVIYEKVKEVESSVCKACLFISLGSFSYNKLGKQGIKFSSLSCGKLVIGYKTCNKLLMVCVVMRSIERHDF